VKANLLLLELVGAKDFEALLRRLSGETLAAASQILEHLLEGDVLLQRREEKQQRQLSRAAQFLGTTFLRKLPTSTTCNE